MRANMGSAVMELPVLLYTVFIVVFFPLIDLGTMGLRIVGLYGATRDAARYARRARSYVAEPAVTDGLTPYVNMSARMAARKAAQGAKHSFLAGVNFDDADVKVEVVKIDSTQSSVYSKPLPPSDVDSSEAVYEYRVTISAQIEPLVLMNKDLFGSVPGLTVPATFSTSASSFVEYTSGLTR